MNIKIKKGLDLNVLGEAELEFAIVPKIEDYAVQPVDFVGMMPKLLVEEGQQVCAGDALFYDKRQPEVLFCTPVDGVVKSVVRGAKRKLLAVVVTANVEQAPASEGFTAPEKVREFLCQKGMWTALRQRPFGIVANPADSPKAIFITACESAPLSADADFVMAGREEAFAMGLKTLCGLTQGKVHLCCKPDSTCVKPFAESLQENFSQLEVHTVSGPHPSGNVGTQIAAIDPINKGEVVWTIGLQDVANMGDLMLTGRYAPQKRFALAGPEVRMPRYYEVTAGASLSSILDQQLKHQDHVRIISGDVFTGTTITKDGFLGAYDTLVTLLPEGDYYDFMGWLLPGLDKTSYSKTFLSGWLVGSDCKIAKLISQFFPTKVDTNLHGGVRPFVFSGNFEKVFPFDIYPLQLIKAAIIGDIELMENLGIYEVEPEDFALCEFIDPSKTEIQSVIREALETIRKEAM